MKNSWKILFLGLAFPGFSFPQTAHALSCAATSLREKYDASDLVYVGYVREIKYVINQKSTPDGVSGSEGHWKKARAKAVLIPEEVFKGTPSKTPTLFADSFFPTWGPWMKSDEAVKQSIPFSWFTADIVPGGRYLVFQSAKGKSILGGCSPHQLLPAQYESPTLKKLRRFSNRAN